MNLTRAAGVIAVVALSFSGCWPDNTLDVAAEKLRSCVKACGVGCQTPGQVCYSDGQEHCSDCVAACSGATRVSCSTDGGDSSDGGDDDGGAVRACVTACGVGCQAPGSRCYSDGKEYCSDCAAACYGQSPRSCNAEACTPGLDQTCNENLGMSSYAGHCVAGTPSFCECYTGFERAPTSGKCSLIVESDGGPYDSDGGHYDGGQRDGGQYDGGPYVSDGGQYDGGQYDGGQYDGGQYDGGLGSVCFVRSGAACWYETADGGAVSGFCGTAPIGGGCSCANFGQGPQALCTGACPPTSDGGIVKSCHTPNCGTIDCSTGTTCLGPNHCG